MQVQKSRTNEYSDLLELFRQRAPLTRDDPRRSELRERLVTGHMPLAEHIAYRFRHRGEPLEDLEQVALTGLIQAVDRFDPDRGTDFLAFAVPTITGVLRRYFRDTGWAVHVPRRLKELQGKINNAVVDLSQRQGRAPTIREIARHLDVDVREVREAMEAGNAYHVTPLDAGSSQGDDLGPAATMGSEDSALRDVEYRESLRPVLEELPERERRILLLRFFRGMTQTEIATRIGISQMHVSRILSATLRQLRERLAGEPR